MRDVLINVSRVENVMFIKATMQKNILAWHSERGCAKCAVQIK